MLVTGELHRLAGRGGGATDAIAGMGVEEGGRFRSGQQEAEVREGRAVVADTGVLIGSTATMHSR